MSGTAIIATAGSETGDGDTVTQSSVSLKGTQQGGKVELRFGGDILGVSLTGTISGTEMVLSGPSGSYTFRPATFEDFQESVGDLSTRVEESRAEAESVEQQLMFDRAVMELQTVTAAAPAAATALSSALSKAKEASAKALASAKAARCYDQTETAFDDASAAEEALDELGIAVSDARAAADALSTAITAVSEYASIIPMDVDDVLTAARSVPALDVDGASSVHDKLLDQVSSTANSLYMLPSC